MTEFKAEKTLKRKVFIAGTIRVETGLHIGGAKSAMDIGGVDLAVIKAPNRAPYIPGSSLRGKLRSLFARKVGSMAVSQREAGKGNLADESEDIRVEELKRLFGLPGKSGAEKQYRSRLIVRDAYFKGFDPGSEVDTDFMDFEFTEVKWENRIDRKSGTAKDPRQLERVPAGAEFSFELVYDSYDEQEEQADLRNLMGLMRMLEDDYLGGHGSRGYGKISFVPDSVQFKARRLEDYLEGNAAQTINDYQWTPSS